MNEEQMKYVMDIMATVKTFQDLINFELVSLSQVSVWDPKDTSKCLGIVVNRGGEFSFIAQNR